MFRCIQHYFIGFLFIMFFSGCATYTPNTEFSSQGPSPKQDNLVIPPGLENPESNSNSNYQMIDKPTYKINSIKGMKIKQGGSQRWLVIESKTVDSIWPVMVSFLSKTGLTIRYQNTNIGVIQTDWATKNNNTSQTDVRAFFEWIGWGTMYTMPTQYMFRITMWQNESQVQIFVTDTQMIEVYPGCGKLLNSTQETSDRQITRWMALPPNPQHELEFLLQFMAYAGLSSKQLAVTRKEAKVELPNRDKLIVKGNTLVIHDQFDRAWWRTALALERVGLGIADKNRQDRKYYVYSLQSKVETPEDGLFSRMFSSSSGTNLQVPEAQYIVQLIPQGQDTQLIITAIKRDENSNIKIEKYLNDLLKQLD